MIRVALIIIALGAAMGSYSYSEKRFTDKPVCVHYFVEKTDLPGINAATCDQWRKK